MWDFESASKRQNFRLQIRSRQIQQKLSSIRHHYQQTTHCDNRVGSLIRQRYSQQIGQIVRAGRQLIDYASQRNKKTIIAGLEHLFMEVQQLMKSISARDPPRANQMNDRQQNDQAVEAQVLSIAIDQIMQTNLSPVFALLKLEGSIQQYLGQQDEPEHNPCQAQQEEDRIYRQFCQKQKSLSCIDETSGSDQSYFAEGQKQMQYKIPYQHQLLLTQKAMQLFCLLLPRYLTLQSATHILDVAWESFKNIMMPSLEEEYPQQIYLEIIYKMITMFNNFTLAGTEGQQSSRDTLAELGVFQAMRYVIEYVVECGRSKHNPDEAFMTSMMKLHIGLLELCQKYELKEETQDAKELTLNLHEHLASYCLYIISLPFLAYWSLSAGLISRLYYNAFYFLSHLLAIDVQLSASIDICSYQQMLSIMGFYLQQKWGHHQMCVVAGVMKVINLVTEDCELVSGNLVVHCNILDQLQACVNKIVGLLNGESMSNDADTNNVQGMLKLLSQVLRNLLKTHNKSRKKQMLGHRIWQNIFELMQSHGVGVLPMYGIFPNYFLCFGRSITLNNMHILLENSRRLQLSQFTPQGQHITELLYEVYTNCECYLNQQEMVRITNLYEMHGIQGIEEWATWE